MTGTAIRRPTIFALVVVVGLHAVAAVQAATYTVGASGCHFTSIQAAINAAAASAGPDVIRIARDQTYTNQELTITGHAVTLIGGYANCADPDPGSDQTTLRGKAPDPPFQPFPPPIVTIGGPSALTVTLRNLYFVDAQWTPIAISGPLTVVLDYTFVTGNSGLYGGGIGVTGSGPTELRLTNGSLVTSNVAGVEGGGIACDGEAQVTIDADSGVAGNSSTSGGGISLRNGCGLYSAAGTGFAGIWANTATTYGGGIYADGGSWAILAGGTDRPATVHSNIADYGGGLYLQDADTVGTALSAWIYDNDANVTGGGVMIASGARFEMERALGPTCHDPIRCSRLSGNRVLDTPGYGGALAVMSEGTALVAETYLENNRASHGAGATAQGSLARLRLEGVVASGNRGSSAFHGASGAALDLAHLTATGNFDPLGEHVVVTIDDGATDVKLLSSIVWEPGDAIFSPAATDATHVVDCLLAHSTAGLPPAASYTTTGDPRFRNAAVGDFHLANDSPAIDYCDNFYGAATLRDVDNEARGLDSGRVDHGIPGANHDLGADESMLLFADGFETGNTTRWSA